MEDPQSLSASTQALVSAIGLDTSGLSGQVGRDCAVITTLGVTNPECTHQVQCTGPNMNGLLVLNCSPLQPADTRRSTSG